MASKYLQLFPVPEGFPEILSDFAREVLRDQPEDIIEYAALYFETLQQGKQWEYDSKFNVKSTAKKQPYQAQPKSHENNHHHHQTHHQSHHQNKDSHHKHHIKENYTKDEHNKTHDKEQLKEHQKDQSQSMGRNPSQPDMRSMNSDTTHMSDKVMAKNYLKELEEGTLTKEYQQRPASSDGMRSPIGSEVSHREEKMLARTYLVNLEKEAFEEAEIINSPTAMGAAAQGRKNRFNQESVEYKSESDKSDKANASGDRPISHKSEKKVASNYVHQLAEDVIREVSPENY